MSLSRHILYYDIFSPHTLLHTLCTLVVARWLSGQGLGSGRSLVQTPPVSLSNTLCASSPHATTWLPTAPHLQGNVSIPCIFLVTQNRTLFVIIQIQGNYGCSSQYKKPALCKIKNRRQKEMKKKEKKMPTSPQARVDNPQLWSHMRF